MFYLPLFSGVAAYGCACLCICCLFFLFGVSTCRHSRSCPALSCLRHPQGDRDLLTCHQDPAVPLTDTTAPVVVCRAHHSDTVGKGGGDTDVFELSHSLNLCNGTKAVKITHRIIPTITCLGVSPSGQMGMCIKAQIYLCAC